MERVGFTMRILPGQAAEYRRRHAAVWPEMLDALKAAGCRDYSIFILGAELFAYLEVDDFAVFRASMERSLAGRDGCAHRSADRSRDGLPHAARGDLPPRMSSIPHSSALILRPCENVPSPLRGPFGLVP